MKKKVSFQTLGCRLNAFETDAIAGQFLDSGQYEVVSGKETADVVVINSCTVTDQADSRNRNAVRRAVRRNPGAKVIVTGCYAQTDPEKLISIDGVSAVVGNDQKHKLFEISTLSSEHVRSFSGGIMGYEPGRRKRKTHAEPFRYGDVVPFGHSRAYLKIQEGCDRRCSYCKIPHARGGGVSRSVTEILEQVNRLQDAGIPEIVLTGVNLGWYRSEGIRFTDLLEKILNRLHYSRLRLSSIEPCDADRPLAELSKHSRFCNFLHVPVQSGSDRILKAMRRTYSRESFLMRMQAVTETNPDLFLGTDVMTGFPGETDEDFRQTLELLKDCNISHVHPFPYSVRQGTVAAERVRSGEWKLVGRDTVRSRMVQLEEYRKEQTAAFIRRCRGAVREAVVEKVPNRQGRAYYEALTGDYIRVRFESGQPVARGALVRLRIGEFCSEYYEQSGKTQLYAEATLEGY